MKANSADHPSLSPAVRQVLAALGIRNGANFKPIVNQVRSLLGQKLSVYEVAVKVRNSDVYINRCVALADPGERKELRQRLLLARDSNHAAMKQMDVEKSQRIKRASVTYLNKGKLAKCTTRHQRLKCFGVIETTFKDREPYAPLVKHLASVTSLRTQQMQVAKYREQREIRDALVANSKHMTSRVTVPDSKLPDHLAPLVELVRRYIPANRIPAFKEHAFRCGNMAPLAVIERFLGRKVGNHASESAAPVVKNYNPAQHVQHGVTVNGVPFKSTHAAMVELGLGLDTDNQQVSEIIKFRAELKAAGTLTHPASCGEYTFELIEPGAASKPKRQGTQTTGTSRPDQSPFAKAVRLNCFDRCVITGAVARVRCHAAHLDEHKDGGVDDYSNGLLMRQDIHGLFDANLIAICPHTLVVNVAPRVLLSDPDLQQYHGQPIAATRQPINTEFLTRRWETFQRLNQTESPPV